MPEELRKVVVKEPRYRNLQQIVYYIAGAIEILILFRLAFKITGANPASGFVGFIYAISDIFVLPFRAVFDNATTTGVETTAVFEPASLIAIAVYAVLAWGIAKFIAILAGKPDDAE
ncbi:MAG: YggT family protein [Candidatus Altimarinota bacterium]